MPLIKACVVITLMRITKAKIYRWTLYTTLGVATITTVIGILVTLLNCKPLSAYWNRYLGACGDYRTVVKIAYIWTVVSVVTDCICATLPWFIIRKLQMTKRAKILVTAILGCGAVASMASIVRAAYLPYYVLEEDQLCEYPA